MRKYIVFLICLSICLLVGSSIYKVYAMKGINDGYLVSSHTTTAIEREIQFNQELEEINRESLLRCIFQEKCLCKKSRLSGL